MKDLRSKLSCIARRNAGLSKGGAGLTRRLARPFIGFTSQIACGAWLFTCFTSGITPRTGCHVELAGDKGEDRGRAAGDDRIFDAVEIRTPRLPVIRVAFHLDRLAGLVFDEFEGTRPYRVGAHIPCRDMARINRRISGGEQGDESRLRPLQVKSHLALAVCRYFVEVEKPSLAVIEAQFLLGFSAQQIVGAFDVGGGERLAVMPVDALAQREGQLGPFLVRSPD